MSLLVGQHPRVRLQAAKEQCNNCGAARAAAERKNRNSETRDTHAKVPTEPMQSVVSWFTYNNRLYEYVYLHIICLIYICVCVCAHIDMYVYVIQSHIVCVNIILCLTKQVLKFIRWHWSCGRTLCPKVQPPERHWDSKVSGDCQVATRVIAQPRSDTHANLLQ